MFNVRQHRNVDSLSDFSESRGCEIPALDKVHKAPATDSMKKENVDKTLFDRLKRCFSLSFEKWDLNVYKRIPKTSGRGY